MLAELIPKLAGMDQKRFRYKPRPSNAGPERCLRSMVYNALGVEPKPLPGRSILVMDDSSWHEELSIDWINKSAYYVHDQQRGVNCLEIPGSPFLPEHTCSDKHDDSGKLTFKGCGMLVPAGWTHGHIDGIVREPLSNPKGREHVLEHKAVSHARFESLETGEDFPDDYICQTCLYDNALRKVYGDELGYAILLVKNKNNARYLEYHIYYDPANDSALVELYVVEFNDDGFPVLTPKKTEDYGCLLGAVRAKFEEVDRLYLAKTLPKRQYGADDWQCSYCGWSQYCWLEYQEEMAKRADKVELSTDVIAGVIRWKHELSKARLDIEEQEDKIKEAIRTELVEKGGKTAIAGDYYVELLPAVREELDKTMIPAEILEKATTKKPYEKLNVKKIKMPATGKRGTKK